MCKYLAVIFSLFFLLSCNDEEVFDPLSEPPYDKITDSIRKEPGDAELYYRRGVMLYGNNQPVFAARDIRKAWELEPKESYALSMVTLLKEKNIDSTILFIESALKKLPGNISLMVDLAEAYHEKGANEKSLSICDDIISKYPGQLDALVLKSTLLKELDKPAEAISILEKAYALSPGDVDVVHALAFDLAENKNPKALKIADSLIRIDVEKNHAEPYYFKGVYYANSGNSMEAIRQFDEAIRRNYNFIQAYINKGIVYYDMKKYEEAMKVFRLATTVSPTEPGPYYWLGKAEDASGKKEEARLDYQRAYQLDKTFTEAKEAADKF